MMELAKAIRLLGPSHMLKLKRGYRAGWEEMIRGYFATQAMHALLNVGAIDEMLEKGALNVERFAASQNLDERILQALCEAFYSLGLLKQNGDSGYSLDSKGRLLVDVLRGWFEVSYGYSEIFHSLEAMLRREKVYGKDFYRRPDFVARGSGHMESWLFFPLAIDIISSKGYRKVMDLGCGDGTFLRKLCRADPQVTAYGIDLAPEAVREGKARLEEEGLQDRVHLMAEDISKLEKAPAPLEGLEAATVFFVLHELLHEGEQTVIDFLKSFKKVFPGVPLIVFEVVRPTAEQMRQKPGIAIYYFLYHELSNQKPASRQEWHALFRKAGFQNVEERYLAFSRTAIFTIH